MKLLPAVCVAAVCAGFLSARADDTPVQAAARAALEQKLNDLDSPQTQPPPVMVTPSGATVVQPEKSANNTVTPQATSPAPAAAPAAAAPVVAAPTEAQPAAAPAMSEPVAAPAATESSNPPAEMAPAAAAPATPPPAETKSAETETTGPGPASAATGADNTPAQAAAREALQQKMNALDNQSPTQPAETPSAVSQSSTPAGVTPAGVPNQPGQVTAVVPGKELGLKSIEAPYVPISATQEAQLQDLLAKYKANTITPEAYHKRRAEILAQP